MSSNQNPIYFLSNFMESTKAEDGGYMLAPLTGKLLSMMRRITRYVEYTYPGARPPITTVSHRFYRTTSLYWLILYYNGYSHPLEIESGAVLRIPALGTITEFKVTGEVQASRLGQTFTI